jgi:hypothetical protein
MPAVRALAAPDKIHDETAARSTNASSANKPATRDGAASTWWNDFIDVGLSAPNDAQQGGVAPKQKDKKQGGRGDLAEEMPWWNRFAAAHENLLADAPPAAKKANAVSERSNTQAALRRTNVAPHASGGRPLYHRLVVGKWSNYESVGFPLASVRLGLPQQIVGTELKSWTPRRKLGRRVRMSIEWTCKKEQEGIDDTLRYEALYMLDRFEYEFLLNLVRTAKDFYHSFEGDKDKTYGTIGQFTAIYRRVIFEHPRNKWEERLSASVFAYKLGTDTPTFSHMRTGGWAFVEYNLHSYRDPTHRFLLMAAPLGIFKDKIAYREAGVTGSRWTAEAAAGIEGSWKIGMVSPEVRAYWAPRWAKFYAYRLYAEFAMPIRITVTDTVAGRAFSEVNLVPKVLYIYNSHPIAPELGTKRELFSWRLPGWLEWLDFRKDLSAYIQVEFRLKS